MILRSLILIIAAFVVLLNGGCQKTEREVTIGLFTTYPEGDPIQDPQLAQYLVDLNRDNDRNGPDYLVSDRMQELKKAIGERRYGDAKILIGEIRKEIVLSHAVATTELPKRYELNPGLRSVNHEQAPDGPNGNTRRPDDEPHDHPLEVKKAEPAPVPSGAAVGETPKSPGTTAPDVQKSGDDVAHPAIKGVEEITPADIVPAPPLAPIPPISEPTQSKEDPAHPRYQNRSLPQTGRPKVDRMRGVGP